MQARRWWEASQPASQLVPASHGVVAVAVAVALCGPPCMHAPTQPSYLTHATERGVTG